MTNLTALTGDQQVAKLRAQFGAGESPDDDNNDTALGQPCVGCAESCDQCAVEGGPLE